MNEVVVFVEGGRNVKRPTDTEFQIHSRTAATEKVYTRHQSRQFISNYNSVFCGLLSRCLSMTAKVCGRTRFNIDKVIRNGCDVCLFSPYRDYVLRCATEDHPGVQGRLGCTRLVMAPQHPSAENGTSLSGVAILLQANLIGTMGFRRPSFLRMMMMMMMMF